MTITVDPSHVGELGQRLRRVGDRLGGAGLAGLADGLGGGLGGDPAANIVADAVRHVEHDWSVQRAVVVAFLDATGTAALQAAAAYHAVDAGVAHAVTPG